MTDNKAIVKKHIKIGFTGFWTGFDEDDNYFTDILRKYYDIELSKDPDYLFCSVFADDFIYNERAVRIFYTGEYQIPDFNHFDYAMGFDHITFGDRYLRVPHYLLYGEDLIRRAQKRGGMMEKPVYREDFCSFVYSNSNADPIREELFSRLNALKPVKSGGGYMNNIGYRVDDKSKFEKQFRFSIAFENSSYPGYMTEKVIQAFAAGTIPVYWGDTEADSILNPKAYINVNKCNSVEEAVWLIIKTDDNKERFMSMLTQSPFVDDDIIFSQQKACEEFLRHIMEMPLDTAFRRNRSMRGRNYSLFFKRYTRINNALRKLKGPFRR